MATQKAPFHVREYDRKAFVELLELRFHCEQLFNQNSGSSTPFNHDQPRGIVATTSANQDLAECYIAVLSQKIVMSRVFKTSARVLVSVPSLILSLFLAVYSIWAEEPFFRADLIFPLDKWHNHGSSIVELPSGELLVAWYRGSGEHDVNDVKVMGARKAQGGRSWSEPFVMADTPNFPDANPVIFIDGKSSLQLISSVILANDWRTSFLTTHMSADYQRRQVAPIWKTSAPLFLDLKEFTANLRQNVEEFVHNNQTYPQSELLALRKKSVGDGFLHRLGWIARSRPIKLPTGRILLPLYSAELSLSMMAISDDGGRSWSSSKPMVGLGNIQPTVVRKKDGTLVAYMRNAGPPPRRLYASVSRDNGMTWSAATHTYLLNPGSAAEIIRLANGYWALAYNDTESGRHSLAVFSLRRRREVLAVDAPPRTRSSPS